jgi:tetratricopeptide (TPR) repeat protein
VTTNDEAQLAQTIQMFEVITESQPLDYQSLEILKEAYFKLGRQKEAVSTSKRIAEAYLSLGQLSSAILEYEGILQQFPSDPDVRRALQDIEAKATNLAPPRAGFESNGKPAAAPATTQATAAARKIAATDLDDGRHAMQKIFVEGRFLSAADFDACWPIVDPHGPVKQPVEPFIQVLADRQLLPLETSIKLLLEKTRLCFLPMEKYDTDMDLARSFPRDVCQRWCILPFDRMSKSILIATANPFNKYAIQELEAFTKTRLLWYLAPPAELVKVLRRVFR